VQKRDLSLYIVESLIYGKTKVYIAIKCCTVTMYLCAYKVVYREMYITCKAQLTIVVTGSINLTINADRNIFKLSLNTLIV